VGCGYIRWIEEQVFRRSLISAGVRILDEMTEIVSINESDLL
jgi:hypothetical protein